MNNRFRIQILYFFMAVILLAVGILQSWNVALTIVNLCLISSIMTLGINIQWGNAGIVNFGVMGFAALGGLANIIISMPPTSNAWEIGGNSIIIGFIIFVLSIIFSVFLFKKIKLNYFFHNHIYWLFCDEALSRLSYRKNRSHRTSKNRVLRWI